MKNDLKFKLNSLLGMNLLVMLVMIIVGANVYYGLQDSYAKRDAIIEFDRTMKDARIVGKAYLQFYDEKYSEQLFVVLGKLKDSLQTSKMNSSYKEELLRQIGYYNDLFLGIISTHKDMVVVTQTILDNTKKLREPLSEIYSTLQSKQALLQSQGEDLLSIENDLISITKDATNVLISLNLAHSDLLRTGDVKVVEDFQKNLKEQIAFLTAPLETLTRETSGGRWRSFGSQFAREVNSVSDELKNSEKLVLKIKDTVMELDTVGKKTSRYYYKFYYRNYKK